MTGSTKTGAGFFLFCFLAYFLAASLELLEVGARLRVVLEAVLELVGFGVGSFLDSSAGLGC